MDALFSKCWMWLALLRWDEMRNSERTKGKSGTRKWAKEKESQRQRSSQGEPGEGRGEVRKEGVVNDRVAQT